MLTYSRRQDRFQPYLARTCDACPTFVPYRTTLCNKSCSFIQLKLYYHAILLPLQGECLARPLARSAERWSNPALWREESQEWKHRHAIVVGETIFWMLSA